ncbi:STAS domain-containing protein [Massilia sp. PWRC2]|uniref:STAS domain-containing protein n=1 Tax=Massilia sp. PWRC2 TaxID=2804626 RepID=UPI003CF5D6B8
MTDNTAQSALENLTFATAASALERGLAAIRGGQTVFDLAFLKSSDSSGVVVLLALLRAGRASGKALSFVNLPVSLKSLLTLYGVDHLLSDSAGTPMASPANLHHH